MDLQDYTLSIEKSEYVLEASTANKKYVAVEINPINGQSTCQEVEVYD